jgi:hypothetical protein
MTDQELLEIEQRANGATVGPWEEGVGAASGEIREIVLGGPTSNQFVVAIMPYGGFGHPGQGDERTRGDLTFIAHARTDVPALVAEVRRLRGLLEGGPPCPFPAGGVWTGQAWVPGDHPLADPANREPVECGAAWPGPPLPWDCACNRPMGHSGNHTHTSPNGVVGSHWK